MSVIPVLFGSAGIYGAGKISDHLTARGRPDAAITACIGLAISTAITGTLVQLTRSVHAAWILLALLNLSLGSGLAPMAISLVTPNQMRGRVAALYLLVINLIGLGLGPVRVSRQGRGALALKSR